MSDPKGTLEAMAMENPNVSRVMEFAKSKPTFKDAFMDMARQRGVNPDQVVNMMRNAGFR